MIQLRIASKYEDRMSIAIRNLMAIYSQEYTNNTFNSVDVESACVDYFVNTNIKTSVDRLMFFIEDTQDVMGIPIIFRFIRDEREGYTGLSKGSGRAISWCKIVGSDSQILELLR